MEIIKVKSKKEFFEKFDKISSKEEKTLMISNLNSDLLNEPEIAEKVLKFNGLTLQKMNLINRNNRSLVEIAIKQSGDAYLYASSILKKEKDLVLLAIEHKLISVTQLSEEFLNDKDVGKALLKFNPLSFEFLGPDNRYDYDLITIGVKTYVHVLKSSKKEYGDDENLIYSALEHKNSPVAVLKYASDRIRNNREFVIKCIEKNGEALKYASPNLKEDEELIKIAINTYPYVVTLEGIHNKVNNNKEIMLLAVRKEGMLFKYLNDELKEDKEFMIAALESSIDNKKSMVYDNSEYVWNTINPEVKKEIFDMKGKDEPIQLLKTKYIKDKITQSLDEQDAKKEKMKPSTIKNKKI